MPGKHFFQSHLCNWFTLSRNVPLANTCRLECWFLEFKAQLLKGFVSDYKNCPNFIKLICYTMIHTGGSCVVSKQPLPPSGNYTIALIRCKTLLLVRVSELKRGLFLRKKAHCTSTLAWVSGVCTWRSQAITFDFFKVYNPKQAWSHLCPCFGRKCKLKSYL